LGGAAQTRVVVWLSVLARLPAHSKGEGSGRGGYTLRSMSLTTGQSLSFYEILGPLGAGGMGEVYLARDTRLDREVAIKVLPEHFADDEDRLRRFEREAKTLASLNHTHIAGIFGIDQVEDTCFLAMELVPGEDLEERLKRGPLAVDEALDVCRQIAEGLEVAHEAGVIHRDLKPANVRITPDGVVKLLDFGLAKPSGPVRADSGSGSGSSSPPKPDSFLMTEEGLILGTPTYMSPEQARGKPVDRRTDIWAFGCVLFECLTGKRAFAGPTFPDVMAAIVGSEPDWSKLPALPARVSGLLRRTLTKDPRERLRDIGEARVLLQAAQGEPASADGEAFGAPARRRSPVLAALVLGLALVVGYPLGSLFVDAVGGAPTADPDGNSTGSTTAQRRALDVELVEFTVEDDVHEVRISPDATHVAWAGRSGLFVRAVGDRKVVQISGVEARSVKKIAWSPDSRQLAYIGPDGLWTVARDGGRPTPVDVLGLASDNRSFSWKPEGFVYSTENDLRSVPVVGGEPDVLLSWESEELLHMHGIVPLPGDGGFLCIPHPVDGTATRIVWRRGAEERVLLDLPTLYGRAPDPSNPLEPSNLLLMDGELYFEVSGDEPDFRRASLSLDPVELGQPVRLPLRGSLTSVAGDGTIAYLDSEVGKSSGVIGWLATDGRRQLFGKPHQGVFGVGLSPDRGSVVYSVPVGGPGGVKCEIWVHELERDLATKRFQFDSQMAAAFFLPDGRLAVFHFNDPSKPVETRAYPVSGQGEGEFLVDGMMFPNGPSDHYRLTGGIDAATLESTQFYQDLSDPASEPVPFLVGGQHRELLMDFADDGEWILYTTNRTGEFQLHLTAFPPDLNKDWAVSGEGCERGWFDGVRNRILFMRPGDEGSESIWSVSCELTPEVRLGRPEELFQVPAGTELWTFDEESERFLIFATNASNKQSLRLVTQ